MRSSFLASAVDSELRITEAHTSLILTSARCNNKEQNVGKEKVIERIKTIILMHWGHALGRDTALKVGRSRVRFPMVSLEFFILIILSAAVWPWGRLSL
jgi:hypothetical protein